MFRERLKESVLLGIAGIPLGFLIVKLGLVWPSSSPTPFRADFLTSDRSA